MKTIHLSISGFNIRIILGRAQTPFYKEKWIEDIRCHLGTYIMKETPIQIDYTIKFTEKKIYPFRSKDEKKSKYISYMEDSGKCTITTFYIISIAQLELILMEIICRLFKNNPGFFIHSSVCRDKSNAFLFNGMEGAGKSTIIKLLQPEYTTIADDSAIIRKIGNSYYVFQTIHHEKKRNIIRTEKKFLLNKFFFLEKSTTCKIVKLDRKEEITHRLMSQILIYFVEDKLSVKHLLKFISEYNNFYILYFPKNNTIKSFLRILNQ